MERGRYVLAIDHGTSGIKASIVSTRGEVMDSDFHPTPIRFLEGGGAEQDPEAWWQGVLATARRLTSRKSVMPEDIAAVCVSSTFSTTVAVDRQGRHIAPALTWMDSRGAPHVQRLMKGFPSFEGYGLSKILRWLPKTAGGPTLSGKDDIAHVLFWKNERPEVYERAYKFLPSKDCLNARLTGELASSFDAVHLFWLTDIRDVNRISYDESLISLSGVDKAKLPTLRQSIDILGPVLGDVADEMGLKRGVQVVMGSPDHQCALIGSGAVQDFEGHVYIGTSSWVQCIVPFKKTDVLHSIASFPTAIPGKYQSVNEQDIAGGSLDFLLNNIMYGPEGVAPGARPEDPYGELTRMAEGVPAGSRKLIFTPWLNGERTPVDDTSARAVIYNISKTTTFHHLARAFLEGVAYNTRWSLKYVERFAGRELDPLTIIGGGARSDLWCQIFADVMDRRVRKTVDPLQANARGAAFIASVGLGEISFDDIPGLMQYQCTFTPDRENRGVYDELFSAFTRIYHRNRSLFRRLNRS
ncbi:MAG TPA: FGGY-family carbohydrate kinase [Deltaproteobacteria bacterium]|nr:FGGY-family carbohydrate kinase [Deltaproteobacteria bacterium]HOI07633.1 FGGY-family carbohydrate kinase [Deltaproteobacteria bacterium]